MNETAFLVVSCDRYSDLWKPYFHCFFKYWPDCPYPVYLGANRKTFADPRVVTLTTGEDRDYSSNLLSMLSRIPQDWVIATVEDRFISEAVDTPRITAFIDAAQGAGAGYAKLIAEFPLAYESLGRHPFGEIPKGARYRLSFTVALWRKTVLERLLVAGESAWEIEKSGNRRANALPDLFLAPRESRRKEAPLSNFHSVVKGRWVRGASAFLKREGLADCLASRDLLPLTQELYVKLFHLRNALYLALRANWKERV